MIALVRRGVVQVVDARLLDDRHQRLEAVGVLGDVLRLGGDRLGVVLPAGVVDVRRTRPASPSPGPRSRRCTARPSRSPAGPTCPRRRRTVPACRRTSRRPGPSTGCPVCGEVVHVRRAAEVAHEHAGLADVGDRLHVRVRRRVPHDHLRVLLEAGLDGHGRELGRVLDRLVGVHVAEQDVVVGVQLRGHGLEADRRAARADLDLDAGVDAAGDQRAVTDDLGLVDGVVRRRPSGRGSRARPRGSSRSGSRPSSGQTPASDACAPAVAVVPAGLGAGGASWRRAPWSGRCRRGGRCLGGTGSRCVCRTLRRRCRMPPGPRRRRCGAAINERVRRRASVLPLCSSVHADGWCACRMRRSAALAGGFVPSSDDELPSQPKKMKTAMPRADAR